MINTPFADARYTSWSLNRPGYQRVTPHSRMSPMKPPAFDPGKDTLPLTLPPAAQPWLASTNPQPGMFQWNAAGGAQPTPLDKASLKTAMPLPLQLAQGLNPPDSLDIKGQNKEPVKGQKPDAEQLKDNKSAQKGKAHTAGKSKPVNKKDKDGKDDNGSGGGASKWVGAFKVASALLVFGTVNGFLFGVPMPVAAGLSAAVAAGQSLTTLKIYKEDNEFSKKLVSFGRTIMGKRNDDTPSGKEWSMVPVWGMVCGAFGFAEAVGNNLYRYFHPAPTNPEAAFIEKQENLQKLSKNARFDFMRAIYDTQLKSVTKFHELKTKAIGYVDNLHGYGKAGDLVKKVVSQVKSGKGIHPVKAVLLLTGVTTVGGMVQTAIAAFMQQQMDQRDGLK